MESRQWSIQKGENEEWRWKHESLIEYYNTSKNKPFLKSEPIVLGQIIRPQEVPTPKYLFLANENNQL